ncbi:MAG: hypothetical protein JXA52_02350 [Planctomycetes bacterium]|nr:hypothetical protein [Planctomycetota bacterium]
MSASDKVEIQVDMKNLYREENYTDLKVASIRCLTPIKADGSVDESRETIYMGQTHIMSHAGPLPVQTELDAKTLEEAMRQFPEAIKKAVDKLIEEAKEYQRQEASRIVVPDAKPGGKIQI